MSIPDQSHIVSFVSDAHARLDAASRPQPQEPGASARALRAALPPLITLAQTIWLPGLIDAMAIAQAALDSLRRQSLDSEPLADAFAAEIRSGLDQTLDRIAAGDLAASIPESLSAELKDLIRTAGGFLPPPVSARPAPVKRFSDEDLIPKPVDSPVDFATPGDESAGQVISPTQDDPDSLRDQPSDASSAEPASVPASVPVSEPGSEPGSEPVSALRPEQSRITSPEAVSDPAVELASETATAPSFDPAPEPGPEQSADPAREVAGDPLAPAADSSVDPVTTSPISPAASPPDPASVAAAETPSDNTSPITSPAEPAPLSWQVHPEDYFIEAEALPAEVLDQADRTNPPSRGGAASDESAQTPSTADASEPSLPTNPSHDAEQIDETSQSAAKDPWAIPAETELAAPADSTVDSSLSPPQAADAEPAASSGKADAPEESSGLSALSELHEKVGRLFAEFIATPREPAVARAESPNCAFDLDPHPSIGSQPTDAEVLAEPPSSPDAPKALAGLGDLHDKVGQLFAEFAATPRENAPVKPKQPARVGPAQPASGEPPASGDSSRPPASSTAPTGLAALGDLHDKVGKLLTEFEASRGVSAAESEPATTAAVPTEPAVPLSASEPTDDPWDVGPEPVHQTTAEPAFPSTPEPGAQPSGQPTDSTDAPQEATSPAPEPENVDDADLASILSSLQTTESGPSESDAIAAPADQPAAPLAAAVEQPADSDAPPNLAALSELHDKISQLLSNLPAVTNSEDSAIPPATEPQAEAVGVEPLSATPPFARAATDPELITATAAQPASTASTPEPIPTQSAPQDTPLAQTSPTLTTSDQPEPQEAANFSRISSGPDDAGFAGTAELTPEQMAAMMSDLDDPSLGTADEFVASEWGSFPVQITPEQVENLQFMVADAKASIEQIATSIVNLSAFGTRDEACTSLAESTTSIQKICDSFAFSSLRTLTALMHDLAASAATVSDALMPELLVRASGIHSLIEQHVRGLECGMEMRWPLATLAHRTKRLLAGLNVHPLIRDWHKGDVFALLELDGVSEGAEPPPKPDDEDNFVESASPTGPASALPAQPTQAEVAAASATAKKPDAESIIRVNASTIDSMLELISQLVLSKNRVFNLSRVLRLPGDQNARLDELATAADELAMLTGNLQLTMMQARMQPTSKLFERYDRVVRDLAGLADKKVNLITGGQNAMIDKNMFDSLGEALAQLLRSIVTKQVKKADQRLADGKPDTATITLDGQSQGSQIIISVEHDGDAPDRATIASVAIEKGLQTAEGLDTLNDNDIFLLPFELDYGDEQLARVGQHVQKLGGTITVRLTETGLTRIEISLPLSVAIVAAILVGVGAESYAIPLQSVEEIIRVSDFQCSMINNRPVIRLREEVLDVVEAASIVGTVPALAAHDSAAATTDLHQSISADSPAATASPAPTAPAAADARPEFGVLLSSGVNRAVLTVDRIIGKQEIVIKKLTGSLAHNRHFAGATIRNDGGISLIFEVAELLRSKR